MTSHIETDLTPKSPPEANQCPTDTDNKRRPRKDASKATGPVPFASNDMIRQRSFSDTEKSLSGKFHSVSRSDTAESSSVKWQSSLPANIGGSASHCAISETISNPDANRLTSRQQACGRGGDGAAFGKAIDTISLPTSVSSSPNIRRRVPERPSVRPLSGATNAIISQDHLGIPLINQQLANAASSRSEQLSQQLDIPALQDPRQAPSLVATTVPTVESQGHRELFQTKPPTHLMCHVCKLPARNIHSVTADKCFHRFCENCVKSLIRARGQEAVCNTCGDFISDPIPDKPCQKEILALPVACNDSAGCNWKGTLRDYQDHVHSHRSQYPAAPAASFQQADGQHTCIYCGVRYRTGEMAGHQDRCSKLPVPCEYCAVRIPRDELSSHHNYDCREIRPEHVRPRELVLFIKLDEPDDDSLRQPPQVVEPSNERCQSQDEDLQAENLRLWQKMASLETAMEKKDVKVALVGETVSLLQQKLDEERHCSSKKLTELTEILKLQLERTKSSGQPLTLDKDGVVVFPISKVSHAVQNALRDGSFEIVFAEFLTAVNGIKMQARAVFKREGIPGKGVLGFYMKVKKGPLDKIHSWPIRGTLMFILRRLNNADGTHDIMARKDADSDDPFDPWFGEPIHGDNSEFGYRNVVMFSQLKETTGNPYVLHDTAFLQIQVCGLEETMKRPTVPLGIHNQGHESQSEFLSR